MSWLKKTAHKFSKSVRRMAHGRFHLNPLKNGAHAISEPVGAQWFRTLKRHQRDKLTRAIDFGRLKKKYKKLIAGDNSASAVRYYDTGSGYLPGGYQYSGRSVSQLMGGR